MHTQLFAGKFELQKEIGKGQTGTIYYGYDCELRQEVAVKIYHSHINGRLIRGKAFIEKSKPLLRLEHPNLLKIFKVEEEHDTPVVCMEFFDAPSLQQIIHQEGPLPLKKMLLLAREITEVLVHIHFQGIIHGTLHPGHVLVSPQGRTKVLDLGLSWILMDILPNCDRHLLRPLPYLLPEIAKGELLTVSSDLYCLGFIMYDMLTKHVPYSGLPKTSIIGKLAFDQSDPDFEFPEGVPEAICELIRQITRNQSQHRLQDATQVLTILNQQLAKLAPDVLPDSSSPSVLPNHAPVQVNAKAARASLIPLSQISTSDLAPCQPPSVNPPHYPRVDQEMHRRNFRRKWGLALGIILLLMGVTLGYWFKEIREDSLSSGSEEVINPSRPLIIERETPDPPTDSLAIMPSPDQESPLQNPSTTEEHNVKPDDLPHIKSSLPAPQANAGIKNSEKRSDEIKKNLAPEPSMNLSEKTGPEKSPIVEKESQFDPDLPSEPVIQTTIRDQPDSVPASFQSDSVETSKTVTDVSTDPQNALPAPEVSPAPSSADVLH